MPARVVDGEGVWRSDKVKKLSRHFRAEYANLLPLAEANGVFDCNPGRIWSDVYAFNRPEITIDSVVDLLDELEHADLLRRWQQGGKTWGYWIGIDKSGRLPPPSHLNRYKNLPPEAPVEIKRGDSVTDTSGSVRTDPSRIGSGLDWIGLVKEPAALEPEAPFEDGQGEDMKIKNEISPLCFEYFNQAPESYATVWNDMTAMVRATSCGQVVNEFLAWAQENAGETFNGKPVSAFLAFKKSGRPAILQAASNPVVVNLVRELVHRSGGDVLFDDKCKVALSLELDKGYTVEEIVHVFKDFLAKNQNDDWVMRRAASTFVQSVDSLVVSLRRTRKEREQEAAAMARKAESMVAEAEAARVAHKALQAQELEAVEETLGE